MYRDMLGKLKVEWKGHVETTVVDVILKWNFRED